MMRKIRLNGKWMFNEHGKGNWKEANVPGCVQMDLMVLGELPDPFYRLNEKKFIDIEPLEWDYRKEFTFEESSYSKVNIVFEGLDTFCDIYFNGSFLGRAENMFIPHTYEVSKLIKEKNEIFVHFYSPIKEIKNIERSSPLSLNAAMEKAKVYVRKAQYSYGWDWGARIAQTGIWREVYIEIIEKGKLFDPFIHTQEICGDIAKISVNCLIEDCSNEEMEVLAEIKFGDKEMVSFKKKPENIGGRMGIAETLEIIDPKFWYPNGFGKQNLYSAKFHLLCKGREVDMLEVPFGIRVIELVQEEDKEGKSFIFKINGEKVFCKGANWIPSDNLLPRLKKEDYCHLVSLAKEANMNMLRVWGGGIYESQDFYDACDKMGIMVWQDFMYACAEYPDELKWFRKKASHEAVEIVKSLRNHPSIVLWCGNNENNWGFHSWWKDGEPEFLGNYVYKQILPKVCAENDPSRPYWVSSPVWWR